MTLPARLMALPVKAYRLIFSPWVGFNCRYHPTCSAYALEALERHGALKGTWLAARRIGRCHPWGGSGIDIKACVPFSATRLATLGTVALIPSGENG